jgi:hypothetical protein
VQWTAGFRFSPKSDVLAPPPLTRDVRCSMRNFIAIGLILAALTATFVISFLLRADTPLPVTASFMGFTNSISGQRLAIFTFTNQSGLTIRRWSGYELRGRSGQFSTVWDPESHLRPGQSEVILVSPPTNYMSWKVYFLCSREGWRCRFNDWLGTGSGRPYRHLVPERLQGVPSQYVRSDWVEQ